MPDHNSSALRLTIQFPYALQALPDVLKEKWNDPDFVHYRDAFPAEHRSSPAALQAYVEDLTRRDVKVGSLKNLQGYLWETGYKSGAYSTPLFPDVMPQLGEWQRSGQTLAIYSSGSVFAQKLLFGHVDVSSTGSKTADMTHLISAWFDTQNAGPKLESSSYACIAAALKAGEILFLSKSLTITDTDQREPREILFFSDNVGEVAAAIAAGLEAILVTRPGNAELSEQDKKTNTVVSTLYEISLSPARIDARFWKR